VLFQHDQLVALGPPTDIVFIMKLDRCDPQDIADMVELWPYTSFGTASDAVDAYCRGMPMAPPDEHLVDLVQDSVCAVAGD